MTGSHHHHMGAARCLSFGAEDGEELQNSSPQKTETVPKSTTTILDEPSPFVPEEERQDADSQFAMTNRMETLQESTNDEPPQEEREDVASESETRDGNAETLEERLRREEEESLELARMLMAEEAMASYHHSVQFLQDSRDQLSQEDYEALQAALREEETEHGEAAAADLEDEDGNLSYETMLQIGERIGDVKAERWTLVAQKHIEKLPIEIFDSNKTRKEDADDSELKCLVCQHEYVENDKLRRLNCGHCFHAECCDEWLSRTDLCPYCRTSIQTKAGSPSSSSSSS